ncbi:MAG: hypothetical protein P4L44_01080 [Oryzomonas sp.]|uniref:hypothetical protein n=1 Tax=Oryzomonas sp. TaxID=2855186 RepID=UPI00284F4251|nr:hypothetical protein [Oryzomonas sp.]MDR3578534.1 hypothetical protein [Oryzomonas sp.]
MIKVAITSLFFIFLTCTVFAENNEIQELKIDNFTVTDIDARSNFINVSIKIEIYNPNDSGKAFIVVRGVDGDGNELERAVLDGVLNGFGSTRLTETRLVRSYIHDNIKNWEIKDFKFKPFHK